MIACVNIDIGNAPDWIALVINLSLLVAAIIGLSTWRKIHKTNIDTQLAEDLYLCTFSIMSKLMQLTSVSSDFPRVRQSDYPHHNSYALLYQSMLEFVKVVDNELAQLYLLQNKFELRYDESVRKCRIELSQSLNHIAIAAMRLRDHYLEIETLDNESFEHAKNTVFHIPGKRESSEVQSAIKAQHMLENICKGLISGSLKSR